ncbi:MAG: SixA phosphatase family protein [Acidimicrobiales bacterium]
MPLLVVRHAPAGRRSAYAGDDRVRPLSPRGRARAAELVPLLRHYRPQRVLSSPFVRCYETVQPLAVTLGLPVESVDELAEGHGADAVRLVHRMAGESAILCTHGDVALELLEALAPGSDDGSKAPLRLQKGDVWVVQSVGDELAIVDRLGRAGGRARKPAKGA